MSRFFEIIKLADGQLSHISNHQTRINRTFTIHFPDSHPFSIEKILNETKLPSTGLFKIRISYSEDEVNTEVQPYSARKISTLKLVNINTTPSFFKSEIRDLISEAVSRKENCDDIIMVSNNLLTDTSYANIALFDGKKWFTPRKPYLYGSHRDALLDNGEIEEKDIPANEIYSYSKIRIFNAMLEFGEVELEISYRTIK
jgi:4-amino-4-deoxychorismate lyase